MIDISVLYTGLETPSTPHRYGRAITQIDPPEHQRMQQARSAKERRPIVVWNLTRTCNLKCQHCYTDSENKRYEGELTTDECKTVLDDLAEFKVPAVLFSGGEPLSRPDVFELAAYARERGLHVVLSTNGTLIDRETAQRLKDLKFAYVGISLDSAFPEVHDRFRGVPGAFDRTMKGFRHCVDVGQKVGLRLTLTRETCENLDHLFDLIEREGIHRACFYHLCPSGRGKDLYRMDPEQSRRAIDTILDRTRDLNERGKNVEILTVDNHCDAPYLYQRMLAEDHPRARQVKEMLEWNGGGRYSSGVGISNIDFNGNVHSDQFSMFRTFGNVRDRKFSEIWQDESDPIMAGLKERLDLLNGRCADCRFLRMCGGGLRARAEVVTGDPWASDPGCYLSDAEIFETAEAMA
ncbi:MAG: radical SAM protein [Verrucomicrobiae bacterium]|nr:radical SAM protein [Verrucomicrobiae bacterium]MCP5541299.1 radical SAM protein [Akkermansiaceae bacterium]MCP5550964.1 radical SAM protein [Akkermansiaceae bacterium]